MAAAGSRQGREPMRQWGVSTMVGMADKGDDTVRANCEYAS